MDFRIDFFIDLAPTWNHLGPQVEAIILALKVIQELAEPPPKTHLAAGSHPDHQNDSKMKPPTFQNDAPDHPKRCRDPLISDGC